MRACVLLQGCTHGRTSSRHCSLQQEQQVYSTSIFILNCIQCLTHTVQKTATPDPQLTKLEFLHGCYVFVLEGSQDRQRLGTAGRPSGRLGHLPLWRGREGREGLRERGMVRIKLCIVSQSHMHMPAKEECDGFRFKRGR